MADFKNLRSASVSRADASIDLGLRSYMLGVYNTMAIGLLITAAAAYAVASLATTTDMSQAAAQINSSVYLTSFGVTFYTSPLSYIVMFAPLVAVLFLSFKINTLSTSAARSLFLDTLLLLDSHSPLLFCVIPRKVLCRPLLLPQRLLVLFHFMVTQQSVISRRWVHSFASV